MENNSTFVTIGNKQFLVDNIIITNDGEVSYSIYAKDNKVTDEDRKNIEDFVNILIGKDIRSD